MRITIPNWSVFYNFDFCVPNVGYSQKAKDRKRVASIFKVIINILL